ncbi:MAG: pseudouridine synthase [Woeseiaceae bacterium]|nr:pseudouridine synthase [Woeseiaceae bacterium]
MPLILLNKPYRVLCQFRDEGDRKTLATFISDPSVYPAGRLDFDSEGLTILTDDGRLQARISNPHFKLDKHYWVQVEGEATDKQISELMAGFTLRNCPVRALSARVIAEPTELWPRTPPIRERRTIPTSWLNVVINKGKNRQVRRMTAAVGLPALRLIRHRVGPWRLEGLQPGEIEELKTACAWMNLKEYQSPPFD